MRTFKFSRARMLGALVVASVALSVSGAFTASNTVGATVAGSGAGTISGYTVSSIAYTLNTTTPSNVDAVSFTLSAAATTVRSKLVNAGSTYYSCTNGGSGNNWTCDTTVGTQATVAASDSLLVVATQ